MSVFQVQGAWALKCGSKLQRSLFVGAKRGHTRTLTLGMKGGLQVPTLAISLTNLTSFVRGALIIGPYKCTLCALTSRKV